MSTQELSYAERKSLMNFGRHLDRLRSRISHKKDHTSQDEAALFVLEKCIGQIRLFLQEGKIPSLEIPASPPGPGEGVQQRELSSLVQFIEKEGVPFERRYTAVSPMGLDELREHLEQLKTRLENEFGTASVPARIVATAIAELQGRVHKMLSKIKARR